MRQENFVLASRVASGELDGNAVVSCLLRSFMRKQERASRGIVQNSGKLVDAETLAELTYSFGRGQPAKALLSYFGISVKPASINFNIPTLPMFFMAHKSAEKLARTGVLHILH